MPANFSGSLADSPSQLRCCCQSPQPALIFDNKGVAAAPDQLIALKSREQPRHRFTRSPKDFGEFLLRQRESQAKFAFAFIILPYLPLDEDSGKPFSC
jgi:hypothetical protein